MCCRGEGLATVALFWLEADDAPDLATLTVAEGDRVGWLVGINDHFEADRFQGHPADGLEEAVAECVAHLYRPSGVVGRLTYSAASFMEAASGFIRCESIMPLRQPCQ